MNFRISNLPVHAVALLQSSASPLSPVGAHSLTATLLHHNAVKASVRSKSLNHRVTGAVLCPERQRLCVVVMTGEAVAAAAAGVEILHFHPEKAAEYH